MAERYPQPEPVHVGVVHHTVLASTEAASLIFAMADEHRSIWRLLELLVSDGGEDLTEQCNVLQARHERVNQLLSEKGLNVFTTPMRLRFPKQEVES